MKKSISIIIKSIVMAALLMVSAGAHAAEVVYRIVEYNKTTQDFILSASGQVPKGPYAWFENGYGATTGNRYNQIPRNRKATLWLTVADDTGILSPTAGARNPAVRKVADRQGIVITTPTHRYGVNGVEKR